VVSVTVVSAVPEHLEEFTRTAAQLGEQLSRHRGRLTHAQEAFGASCSSSWLSGPVPDLAGQLRQIVTELAVLADDVGATAAAMRMADTSGAVDVVKIDQATLDALRAGEPASPELVALLRSTPAGPEMARVWAELTPEQRARLLRAIPELVGNADGIPFRDRYLANHLMIERDLATERAKPSPDRGRIDRLGRLADMQVVIYQPDKGRIATVRGDIETAHHVGVFVPGTSSSFEDFLDGTNGTDNKAKEIYVEADRAAPGDVAVISWLGYDAPPSIPDAAFPGRAEDGGRLLTSFTRDMGLRPDQHLTLVGHSYGSTVIGRAALDGAPARDLVVLGSPGMGVDHASDLHLPGTVYAERAPQDPVANLESFGQDPTSPSFGGTRLTTNRAGRPEVVGHSRYFDPRTESVANVGRVVAGAGPQTQGASPGDWAVDLNDRLPSPADPLHIAARDYHGPAGSVVGAVDRIGRTATGWAEAGGRNVVDDVTHAPAAAKDYVEDQINEFEHHLTHPFGP
jgi:hypothetical protein